MICTIGNPVFDEIHTPWGDTDGRILSGCATNAALAYAKLGGQAFMIGCVGEDERPTLESTLDELNIVHQFSSSLVSGGFKLAYDDQGRRDLSVLGIAANINELPGQIDAYDAVVLGPILQEISPELILKLRESYDGKLLLDPQGMLRTVQQDKVLHIKPEGIEKAIGACDIVKPNELECEILTGLDPRKDVRAAAKLIKSWGPDLVIITLAELGSVIYDGQEFIDIPPYKTTMLDPTGAGDTYAGGFLFALLSGNDIEFSGRFASCVSSIMIEHMGPEFPLDREEVVRRLETLPETVTIPQS